MASVIRALASYRCGPASNTGVDARVEFVVGSLHCSERFFSSFPVSSRTPILSDIAVDDSVSSSLGYTYVQHSWVNL